ncbi:pyroglutamylated RFamide peptide receptor-like [Stylophora pistillata]|uniref:pyroglutamylated RFamide peptide receptor-like n=1 Tax=Stylophora pistillata TaxID=50429 RepID=UPI000C04AF35|nr:pyroglutamylated RFamide peptide receptor-like [Stylophora pistillata]
MTFVYSKVVYMLWFKRNEQNELTYQQKGVLKVRKRVTLSVITVSAIFGACEITGSLIYLLSHFDIFRFGSVPYIVSDTLIMFNSVVNPYIYARLNERFRQKLRLLCSTSHTSRVQSSC